MRHPHRWLWCKPCVRHCGDGHVRSWWDLVELLSRILARRLRVRHSETRKHPHVNPGRIVHHHFPRGRPWIFTMYIFFYFKLLNVYMSKCVSLISFCFYFDGVDMGTVRLICMLVCHCGSVVWQNSVLTIGLLARLRTFLTPDFPKIDSIFTKCKELREQTRQARRMLIFTIIYE